MIYTGSDLAITINGVDYTGSVYEFSESGGDIQYTTIKTYGNNYSQIKVGRTNYSVDLSFKLVDASLKTIFETTTPVSIAVATGSSTGSGFSVTYSNAVPINLNLTYEVEDMATGKLSFDIPPLSSGGTDNRSIL